MVDDGLKEGHATETEVDYSIVYVISHVLLSRHVNDLYAGRVLSHPRNHPQPF